ncbi:MAG: glycosyltransferase family 2 protein [Candidatus Omnitrophota bacterium]|nr:MAG: glycosyltransferase family 2 protein [Candidatus Omnitrophota bacterium]
MGNNSPDMGKTVNYPPVSIVIGTRNRCNILKHCLDSIAALNYPGNLLELIVLDDASNDSTPHQAPYYLNHLQEGGFKRVRFLRNEHSVNIARGRYILGKKVSSDSEMVLFVDDDVYLEPACLKNLVEYMVRYPHAGIVGPRIVYANNPKETAHGAHFVGGWTARYWSKDASGATACDWVYSTCMLARKEVLDETGGFYPGYYTAHEEVDFCLRAKKAGFQVVYQPSAVIQHEEDVRQIKRERLYYLYRNKLLLIHRNFSLPRKIVALSLALFFGLPKYLLESIKFHKGFAFSELTLIFLSIWHGILAKSGPRKNVS